jgi:CDP-diacylglycerol---serine O-phosphatidyltransferase
MTEKRHRRRMRDKARLQSGLTIVPSLFTIGNIFCGYYAVIATLKQNYDYAAIAIGLGTVLDMLDGRIARLTKTASDFGVQLDSLADVLTFGIAPAMLAFSWGLTSSDGIEATVARHVRQLGWLATFAFVVCGALRLARFNIQASRKTDEPPSKRYFVGLPIPAGAGMIAAVVHFFKTPILMIGSALLWCFLILLVAFLMISTVRYSSFKDLDVKKLRPRLILFGTAMFIGLTIFYSEIVLLCLATIYVSSGPVMHLLQLVRRFLPARVSRSEPRSEPAHGNIKS